MLLVHQVSQDHCITITPFQFSQFLSVHSTEVFRVPRPINVSLGQLLQGDFVARVPVSSTANATLVLHTHMCWSVVGSFIHRKCYWPSLISSSLASLEKKEECLSLPPLDNAECLTESILTILLEKPFSKQWSLKIHVDS